MPVRLLPDAERLVTSYLRGQADVTAIVGSRVTTELPDEPVLPAVTLSRVGGVPSLAGYLDGPRLEIYAWATTKQQAEELARTVEAAMLVMVGAFPLGTVTGAVEEGVGLRWMPDEATDTPRYQMLFEIYVHPPAP